MFDWIASHGPEMISLVIGMMFISASKVFEPLIKGGTYSAGARWIAFALTALGGLMLGYGLFFVVRWLTGLGTMGGAIGASIGTIITVIMGWQAFYMIIALVRDLMDKVPDAEARKAARWLPTCLPAGGGAISTLLSNPRAEGFGLGVSVVTAVIVSAITMAYTFKIFKAVDLSKAGAMGWKIFAAVVAFISGFIHIAMIAYADSLLANVLPAGLMLGIRVIAGVAGGLLLVCAFADVCKDRTPDTWVRRAGVFGVPLTSLFFSVGATAVSGGAASALELMQGWSA